jgi:hypothetical protein
MCRESWKRKKTAETTKSKLEGKQRAILNQGARHSLDQHRVNWTTMMRDVSPSRELELGRS